MNKREYQKLHLELKENILKFAEGRRLSLVNHQMVKFIEEREKDLAFVKKRFQDDINTKQEQSHQIKKMKEIVDFLTEYKKYQTNVQRQDLVSLLEEVGRILENKRLEIELLLKKASFSSLEQGRMRDDSFIATSLMKDSIKNSLVYLLSKLLK